MDYESMTTEELETILRRDLDEYPNCTLSTETILEICRILADRNPIKPDAQSAYRQFMTYYYPEVCD